MGQGGYLNIVNATFSDLHLIHHHCYQMNTWLFPPVIRGGEGSRIYIEWDEGFLKNHKDDAGEAVYQIYGTGRQFEIQARADPYRIQVWYKCMDALNKPPGHVDILGWRHNADVTFVVMERFGMYHTIAL